MTYKIEELRAGIDPIPEADLKKYRDYWDSLVHPTGSLGQVEEVGIKLCGILEGSFSFLQ